MRSTVSGGRRRLENVMFAREPNGLVAAKLVQRVFWAGFGATQSRRSLCQKRFEGALIERPAEFFQ